MLLTLTNHNYSYGHCYRPKDDTAKTRVSGDKRFLSVLLSWWGTVNNAHEIDQLALTLEHLTAFTTEGFEHLTHVEKLLANADLQERLGLDYLIAAEGGLRHVIVQEC